MPLRWKRGENPYRLNYFRILRVGANAKSAKIAKRRDHLSRIIKSGGEHCVEGRPVSEADVMQAGNRLIDSKFQAPELLLVHYPPAADEKRLSALRAAVDEAAECGPSARPLPLADLVALAPLIPGLHQEDLPRPSWTELSVPGPDSPQDLDADIQFDL